MTNLKSNKAGTLLKIAFKKWYKRDPFREGAIIAYNAIFALPGLLVVTITLTGYIFGVNVMSNHLHTQIAEAIGNGTSDQVQQMIIMSSRSEGSLWATVIGIATILIGATGVFVELQKSFNNIWGVKSTTAKAGIWKFLKIRIFSFGLIISIAFLLLTSLVISTILSAFGSWLQQYWSVSLLVIFESGNFILSLVIFTILFAIMFKILPDAKVKWSSVWIGAFITSALFVIGKSALGLYFGKADPGARYGAAGSLILILLWTSYSTMIVYFGAEFTKVYSDYFQGEVVPSESGVKEKYVLNKA
jgi:membrane protein